MARAFITRAGKSYFLKSKLTSKGNKTYYMTATEDDDCLDIVPHGYEIFEKPDIGMLYVRKSKPSKFSEEELKTISRHLKKNEELYDYQIDSVGKTLKIYTAEKELNERLFKIWESQLFPAEKIQSLRKEYMRFEERMRVIKEKDGYTFQRYCYRGSVDGWINIDGGTDLEELAEQNIKHLGFESYYDLF